MISKFHFLAYFPSLYRFLTNAVKDFETRKWAAEGLSYLTLDADVKEDLVRDPVAVKVCFLLIITIIKTYWRRCGPM